MMYKSILLIVVMLIGGNCVWGQVILDQDFESPAGDPNIFAFGEAFGLAGEGDGNTTEGLWRNPVVDGNFTPKTDFDNSSFSEGSQCVYLSRGSTYGSGIVEGLRLDAAATGGFIADCSIKVAQESGQFAMYLISPSGAGLGQVGCAYYADILHTRDNGEFKPKSSGVVPGEWFRIRFVGDINMGSYDSYVDWGDGLGWRPLSVNQAFDNAILTSVSGIYATCYVAGLNFYIDDVRILSDTFDPADCAEATFLGYKLETDIDGDCHVDLADLADFSAQWMRCVEPGNSNCDAPWQ